MPARRTNRRRMLEKDEELELVLAWKERGDERALATLCSNFEPLVRRMCASRMRSLPVDDREDLFQLGREGFLEGLDRFEPDKGFRLATYVSAWIENRMRWGSHDFDLVHYRKSARLRLGSAKLVEVWRLHEARHGAVTEEAKSEIQAATGLTPAEQDFVVSRLKRKNAPIDVFRGTADSEDGEHSEHVLVSQDPDPEESCWRKETGEAKMKSILGPLLDSLPERQAAVLRTLYFNGREEERKTNQRRASRVLGISDATVRTLHKEALSTLRGRMEAAGWTAGDFSAFDPRGGAV